jgi:predicted Zn-dependent peptidase
MADRQFSRVAFAGHPYSYIETPETVTDLTRNDIRTFHRTYYRPNNALLIIVGDLTVEEAQAQAERAFGLWMPAEVPELFDYPDPEPADTSVIYLVDRPDSEQATIQVGNIAIDARSPDRYALEVVNSLLGTGSSSRLYLNLREEKGYTYGVYSRFARPNDEGTFRVLGDFNPETAGAAIVEILAELEEVQSELIPEEELENAKGKIVGGFALAMEDPSTFAGQLAVRALTGVPIEELNEYLPSIEAVTAEEAQAVAAQYIDAESPIIVVVGNAELLKPQLEEIMPVRAVDGDGNVVEDTE